GHSTQARLRPDPLGAAGEDGGDQRNHRPDQGDVHPEHGLSEFDEPGPHLSSQLADLNSQICDASINAIEPLVDLIEAVVKPSVSPCGSLHAKQATAPSRAKFA
ncbi:MAG: hypothetical protein WA701_12755, partial [Solirubrobacterales bacterium]